MAIKFICDRCGGEAEAKQFVFELYEIDEKGKIVGDKVFEYDLNLCEKCMDNIEFEVRPAIDDEAAEEEDEQTS